MAFCENNKHGVLYMTSDKIAARHAFTTRYGGVSRGAYASLNFGVHRGDEDACVDKNYAIACKALDIPRERLVFSHQVHECTVRKAAASDAHTLFTDIPYTADGLVTDEPGLPLIIFTADCIPVLLSDPVRGAIGAVHAGWRGTSMDIVGAAVRKMAAEYGCAPENIRAAIGPSIGLCCFQTGPEVPEAMERALGAGAASFINPDKETPGKYRVDLKGINGRLLTGAGLLPENIDISEECTMCSHDKYWSHRYTGGIRGSQASVIMLKSEGGGNL